MSDAATSNPSSVAGLGDRERPDAGAAQRGEVTADAERGAEVAGERADVGARRALDAHVEVDGIRRRARGASTSNADTVTARGFELDLLAVAHELVGALAVDLDGADRARHLVDVAA